ncbi:helix-turn-helix domain-containing protein [Parathermosynechococcus lividus]
MTYKRLSETERQRVFQQYSQGLTVKDLATEFGVSENTIRRIIKQMETESPPLPLLSLAAPSLPPEADSTDEEELEGESLALDEDDYDDSDEDELDEDELGIEPVLPDVPEIEAVESLEVMPLAAATLPRPCYVVVDRRAELLTRPLEAFRGLGPLSSEEAQQSTLPIFDSRPVALRYSQQNQRLFKASDVQWRKTVVKVPDGEMLRKVTGYLQAKGITRVLYHGRVYALDLE